MCPTSSSIESSLANGLLTGPVPSPSGHEINTRAAERHYRVGVDVGGTFTDFVVSHGGSGRTIHHKEPSTSTDPSLAVERGLLTLISEHGIQPAEIEVIVHGTTIGLNTIIQRKGARLSLIVSRGNRDILEIARGRMPEPYNMFAKKEEPLVSRDRVFECSARLDSDGHLLTFPSKDELDVLAARIESSLTEAVTISLLNSYMDPEAERQLGRELANRLPCLPITLSSTLWPEIREYERSLISILNAYIHPLMDDYLLKLEERLIGIGVTASIFVTASNGGSLSIERARERPVDTILSGPASGVRAATHIASKAGFKAIITIDMGGTSSDMSITESDEPETTTLTHVGDYPLVLPVVNVSAIGSGGGSIVWVDPQGVLKVGPRSAGAIPGPVCYATGGTEPTITDCYLALGYLQVDRFAAGSMRLDIDACLHALEAVATQVGITGPDRAQRLAASALQVATAKMATEMIKVLAKRGSDPRDFVLIPFGGAGPTQANLLAEEAQLNTILIPSAPGLFCAFGALLCDIRRDFVHSFKFQLTESSYSRLAVELAGLQLLGDQWLDSEAVHIVGRTLRGTADMRYLGQSYELNIDLPDPLPSGEEGVRQIAALFHDKHRKIYGFADDRTRIEFHSIRVSAIGVMPKLTSHATEASVALIPPARRRIWLEETGWCDIPVYQRSGMAENSVIAGPVIIEQSDTTTVVLSGWTLRKNSNGSLLIEKKSAR